MKIGIGRITLRLIHLPANSMFFILAHLSQLFLKQQVMCHKIIMQFTIKT